VPVPKDIRQEDCAQVGVETLWRSFYLVWKPSSQEVPGPSYVLSAPSPEQWDAIGCRLSNQFLLAPTEIKPVYYSIPSTVWALGKSCLSTCRHPHSLAQSSYIMSLASS
jgi:hypothetical protein